MKQNEPLAAQSKPVPASPEQRPPRGSHCVSVNHLFESWKNVSIKWRIFGSFAALAAVVLVVLWLFQTVFFDQFYEQTKRNELSEAAETIQQNLYSPNLSDMIENTARSGQIYAVGIRADGQIIFNNDFSPNRFSVLIGQHLMEVLQKTVAEGGKHYEIIDSKGGGKDSSNRAQVYATVKQDGSGNEYMIFLYTILTPMDATIRTIRTQIIWLTLILLGVGALLALYLSHHISSPIIRITETAKELATGDYDVSFDENAYHEISQLAHTLNYAARELGRVEHLQRDLVANISHDLRTPLTMISGYAEIMRDLPGENTPENVQIIIDEANRLTSLVNDTLDLSKLQSGTQKVEKTEFD